MFACKSTFCTIILTHLHVDRKKCVLINEIATLCCHAEAHFAAKYHKWANQHLSESMLPGNVKACKENSVQQSINAHLTECKVAE
ncbi:hypothetical protein BDR04DRAFT_1017378 [Suillus decipiens]|nr:hypothetical protein BDR04DRAFT_1017378 [Suillus decipiens]